MELYKEITLKKAKARFPANTKFLNMYAFGGESEILEVDDNPDYVFSDGGVHVSLKNETRAGSDSQWIFHYGDWAERVEDEKEEIVLTPVSKIMLTLMRV